mmetsp:Transcript_19252/g.38119  ORF Transcript_19252/g.38119 Transcript_19252/m.38119 type:complete len:200 (+) Transcript_19252:940-1539(+)
MVVRDPGLQRHVHLHAHDELPRVHGPINGLVRVSHLRHQPALDPVVRAQLRRGAAVAQPEALHDCVRHHRHQTFPAEPLAAAVLERARVHLQRILHFDAVRHLEQLPKAGKRGAGDLRARRLAGAGVLAVPGHHAQLRELWGGALSGRLHHLVPRHHQDVQDGAVRVLVLVLQPTARRAQGLPPASGAEERQLAAAHRF